MWHQKTAMWAKKWASPTANFCANYFSLSLFPKKCPNVTLFSFKSKPFCFFFHHFLFLFPWCLFGLSFMPPCSSSEPWPSWSSCSWTSWRPHPPCRPLVPSSWRSYTRGQRNSWPSWWSPPTPSPDRRCGRGPWRTRSLPRPTPGRRTKAACARRRPVTGKSDYSRRFSRLKKVDKLILEKVVFRDFESKRCLGGWYGQGVWELNKLELVPENLANQVVTQNVIAAF